MAEIDVLKAQIVRASRNVPWGFRLQGGAEQGEPVKLLRVTPGSPAARIGLKSGDEITEIGDVPTANFSLDKVHEFINEYDTTLILTVERRAHGALPMNPVLSPQQPESGPKGYQTYDMSGSGPTHTASYGPAETTDVDAVATVLDLTQQPGPVRPEGPEAKFYQTFDLSGPRAYPASKPQHNYNFQTVTARPYTSPPVRNVPTPQQPRQAPQQQQTESYQPSYQSTYQISPSGASPSIPQYQQPTAPDDEICQSRSFHNIRDVMSYDHPRAGDTGLPPPRSAFIEKKMEDDLQKRRASGQRVKVFMPQQYNSPMGMYSAPNVVDAFQSQAEGYFTELDSQPMGSPAGRPYGKAEEQGGQQAYQAAMAQKYAISDF